MLVIGLGIGMIIAGITTLIRGRLKLSNTKEVKGVWAYLLGLALMAALPLGFLVAFIYMLMNVDFNKPNQADQWGKEHDLTLSLIVAGVEVGIGLLVVIIGATLAKPLPADEGRYSRRPRDDHDDEDDRRPRRRRSADYDDEDRPARRRSADYDDRPPRPRDDLDERAR